MVEFDPSKRLFLKGAIAGAAALALGQMGCNGENPAVEPIRQTNATVSPTPRVETRNIERVYLNPVNMEIPRLDFNHEVEVGVKTKNNALIIPEGGHVTDYSRAFPAGNNTTLISGHSYWHDVKQPMSKTFDLLKKDAITILDSQKGLINFEVDERLILDWDQTVRLIWTDRSKNTLITFTSLRSVEEKNGKEILTEQLAKDKAKSRADNSDEVELFGNNIVDLLYRTREYIYWVTLSNQT